MATVYGEIVREKFRDVNFEILPNCLRERYLRMNALDISFFSSLLPGLKFYKQYEDSVKAADVNKKRTIDCLNDFLIFMIDFGTIEIDDDTKLQIEIYKKSISDTILFNFSAGLLKQIEEMYNDCFTLITFITPRLPEDVFSKEGTIIKGTDKLNKFVCKTVGHIPPIIGFCSFTLYEDGISVWDIFSSMETDAEKFYCVNYIFGRARDNKKISSNMGIFIHSFLGSEYKIPQHLMTCTYFKIVSRISNFEDIETIDDVKDGDFQKLYDFCISESQGDFTQLKNNVKICLVLACGRKTEKARLKFEECVKKCLDEVKNRRNGMENILKNAFK